MEEEAQREAELQRALEEERLAAEAAAQQTEEQTEAPAEETEAPVEQTEAPVEETEAPAEQTEAPVEETEAPAEQTEAPAEEVPVENNVYVEDTWETVWATEGVNVRAYADSSSDRVGSLSQGESVTRTGICDNGWSRVDYNGATAYIHSDYLTTSEPVAETPSYNEENTNTSSLGQQIVDFARQFIGGPYVWGGTSLTNGADCSGFVQSVYANFGYSLPRTCTPQLNYGYSVSFDELQPGDLIGYAYGGEIGHIAIYTGNGNIVHASDYSTGIIETSMYYWRNTLPGYTYC